MLSQLQGRVLPGVPEWIRDLQNLREPPVMGLLTGNIILGAQIKLSHFQLWNPFVMGAFGSDHEDRNELARVARARGNRRLGKKLAGDEILVIGDTPRDIECGRAIGAKVLAVATGGYKLEQLRQDRPAWAVESLEQISVREVCE
jgi:phosphoglycolate phosphatase-like HAD superfamily hydrolase